VAAVAEFVADRRAVVEMRLADGTLTVIRANRTKTSYDLLGQPHGGAAAGPPKT
jgi:hypothetical protein